MHITLPRPHQSKPSGLYSRAVPAFPGFWHKREKQWKQKSSLPISVLSSSTRHHWTKRGTIILKTFSRTTFSRPLFPHSDHYMEGFFSWEVQSLPHPSWSWAQKGGIKVIISPRSLLVPLSPVLDNPSLLQAVQHFLEGHRDFGKTQEGWIQPYILPKLWKVLFSSAAFRVVDVVH